MLRFDWVHSAFQDGVVTTELYLFVKAGEAAGSFTFEDLEEYFRWGWGFPASGRSQGLLLFRVFDSYRATSAHKHEKLKCRASELLAIFSLFRHYVETRFITKSVH